MIFLAGVALIFAVATAAAALADVADHRRASDSRPADPPSHVRPIRRPRPYDWQAEQ